MFESLKQHITKRTFLVSLVGAVFLVMVALIASRLQGTPYQNGGTLRPTPTTLAVKQTVGFYPAGSNIDISNIADLLSASAVHNNVFSTKAYSVSPITQDFVARRLGLTSSTDVSGETIWRGSQYLLHFYTGQFHIAGLFKDPKKISITQSSATTAVTSLLKVVGNLNAQNISIEKSQVVGNEFVFYINPNSNGIHIVPQVNQYTITVKLFGDGKLDTMDFSPFAIDTTVIETYDVLTPQDARKATGFISSYLLERTDPVTAAKYANVSIALSNVTVSSYSFCYLYEENNNQMIPAYTYEGVASGVAFWIRFPAINAAYIVPLTPTPIASSTPIADF